MSDDDDSGDKDPRAICNDDYDMNVCNSQSSTLITYPNYIINDCFNINRGEQRDTPEIVHYATNSVQYDFNPEVFKWDIDYAQINQTCIEKNKDFLETLDRNQD